MKAALSIMVAVMVLLVAAAAAHGVRRPPPKDPLVVKQAWTKSGYVKIVRAVFNGNLYVLVFVHHDGVWWLAGSELATDLPAKPHRTPVPASHPKTPTS